MKLLMPIFLLKHVLTIAGVFGQGSSTAQAKTGASSWLVILQWRSSTNRMTPDSRCVVWRRKPMGSRAALSLRALRVRRSVKEITREASTALLIAILG